MATIPIPVDDDFLPIAIEKIAIHLDYQDEIEDIENPGTMIPNPDSKVQTIKNEIYRQLKAMYRSGVKIELEAADQTIIDQAEVDAETGIGD